MADFSAYTGERDGFFYDPNWGQYFPIASHAGAYRDWSTGIVSTAGSQAAFQDDSRQQEYVAQSAALPPITQAAAVAIPIVDLARTSVPGSIQSIASQPTAVPVSLGAIPYDTPSFLQTWFLDQSGIPPGFATPAQRESGGLTDVLDPGMSAQSGSAFGVVAMVILAYVAYRILE